MNVIDKWGIFVCFVLSGIAEPLLPRTCELNDDYVFDETMYDDQIGLFSSDKYISRDCTSINSLPLKVRVEGVQVGVDVACDCFEYLVVPVGVSALVKGSGAGRQDVVGGFLPSAQPALVTAREAPELHVALGW